MRMAETPQERAARLGAFLDQPRRPPGDGFTKETRYEYLGWVELDLGPCEVWTCKACGVPLICQKGLSERYKDRHERVHS